MMEGGKGVSGPPCLFTLNLDCRLISTTARGIIFRGLLASHLLHCVKTHDEVGEDISIASERWR